MRSNGIALKEIARRMGRTKDSLTAKLARDNNLSVPETQNPPITPAPTVVPTARDEVAADIRREINARQRRDRKERGYAEMLIATLQGAVPRVEPPPPMPEIAFKGGRTPTLLIELWSDHHGNQVVDPLAIEGFNAYNFDIYARRLYSIVKKTIAIAQAQYTQDNIITGLAIDILGDMGTDANRPEHIATNEFSEEVAAILSAHLCAQALDLLGRAMTRDRQRRLFSYIEVRGVVGNEGRRDKKINFTQPWRSWDWLIYQWIAASLGDYGGRVRYHIPYSPMTTVVDMGWTFLLSHGNEIQGGSMGIPWYGFQRMSGRQQHLRRGTGGYDYHVCGHFHTGAMIPVFGDVYVNPSLVGAGGYSHNSGGWATKIGQTLLAVTEEIGVIGHHILRPKEDEAAPFVYNRESFLEGAHLGMARWLERADVESDVIREEVTAIRPNITFADSQ